MRDNEEGKQDVDPVARSNAPIPALHPLNGDAEFRLGNIQLKYNIQKMVCTLIVAAVLLPAARYSIGVSSANPAELIVAISIAVFSSLLCLWLLDAIGIFPFRSIWVSRSVYGAAVVSILSTSAGVYQGAFSDRKFPFEGLWSLQVNNPDGTLLLQRNIVLIHSENADTYWGYSDLATGTDIDTSPCHWLEVKSLDPDLGRISLHLVLKDGKTEDLAAKVLASKLGKRVDPAIESGALQVSLRRPY